MYRLKKFFSTIFFLFVGAKVFYQFIYMYQKFIKNLDIDEINKGNMNYLFCLISNTFDNIEIYNSFFVP